MRAGYGNKRGKGIVKAGYGSSIKKKILILPHPLTALKCKSIIKMSLELMMFILEIIYLRKIKNGAYVVNLDEYADVGARWIALYLSNNEDIYFDSFGVEYVPKEIMHFIGHKNIKTSKSRMQVDNSIMCGYFCIKFIDFMLANKTLIDYTSLFSPYDYKKEL